VAGSALSARSNAHTFNERRPELVLRFHEGRALFGRLAGEHVVAADQTFDGCGIA
jgi:hypothetical protein